MRFTLPSSQVRGDQLADEIFKSTGIVVAERYMVVPPNQVEINGPDIDAQAALIQQTISAHQPQAAYWPAEQESSSVRTRVRTLAQSAVGVLLTDLTAAQVRALLACLLYKERAIDADGKIKPLAEWVK